MPATRETRYAMLRSKVERSCLARRSWSFDAYCRQLHQEPRRQGKGKNNLQQRDSSVSGRKHKGSGCQGYQPNNRSKGKSEGQKRDEQDSQAPTCSRSPASSAKCSAANVSSETDAERHCTRRSSSASSERQFAIAGDRSVRQRTLNDAMMLVAPNLVLQQMGEDDSGVMTTVADGEVDRFGLNSMVASSLVEQVWLYWSPRSSPPSAHRGQESER